MKKILSLACFLVAALCMVHAQVNFTVTHQRVSPTEVDIVFTGKVADGWHVFSANLEPGGPTPTTFNLDKIKGAKLKGNLQEGAGKKTEFDDIFEMNVGYFERECVFTQRVELTEKEYSVEGYLDYQACTEGNCVPGKKDFRIVGADGPAAPSAGPVAQPGATDAEKAEAAKKAETPVVEEPKEAVPAGLSAEQSSPSAEPAEAVDAEIIKKWWTPVVDELRGMSGSVTDQSLFYIFILGFLGGLIALCTPCVWPIIPMTVSFFLKRSKDRKKGIRDAVIYGIAIVVIYVSLGLIITTAFGASALNDLSTNAVFNIFFFLMLLVFAASFFGGFELTLPSSWGAAVDSKAERTTGFLSIFLMAFTLALVSFSCTGPIIGLLLVEVATNGGSAIAPTIGMFGFALALALPFTLFALFPAWLKSAPKSGGWLNVVKVTLGFLELAFALKFLSVADLAYKWHLLDRETFLALWIVIFALLGVYLLGKIKFPHDDDTDHVSVPRFFAALCSLAFAVYMIPGLWGAPLKAVSAFAPPMYTQDFNLDPVKVEAKFTNYEEGMAYARREGKPVIVDFTGYGCVNCRQMETTVWRDDRVIESLTEDFVLISLYVDDKTRLPETITKEWNGTTEKLRTVGDHWSFLQKSKFGVNAQPYYVALDNEGQPLTTSFEFNTDANQFRKFLDDAKRTYVERRKSVAGE